jgi:hypothetical protein
MEWRSAIGRNWSRWSDAMKRELLREPDRVLLDRGPETVAPPREKAGLAEASAEIG